MTLAEATSTCHTITNLGLTAHVYDFMIHPGAQDLPRRSLPESYGIEIPTLGHIYTDARSALAAVRQFIS